MDHGAPGARTGELLSSPQLKGQEQHSLTLNDYGLGVDCHSGFFQICVLVSTEKSLLTHEITVLRRLAGTHEGEAHGSLCARSTWSRCGGRRPPLHVGIDGSVPQANLPRLAGTSFDHQSFGHVTLASQDRPARRAETGASQLDGPLARDLDRAHSRRGAPSPDGTTGSTRQRADSSNQSDQCGDVALRTHRRPGWSDCRQPREAADRGFLPRWAGWNPRRLLLEHSSSQGGCGDH